MKKILLIFLFVFAVSGICIAQNKVYIAPETSIVFSASGGDEVLHMGQLPQNNVAGSSFLDLGAASRSSNYVFTLFVDGWASAPVAGDAVNIYFGQGTSTADFDGAPIIAPTDGATATVSQVTLPNLIYGGSAVATSTAVGGRMRISGFVRFFQRYIYIAIENNASAADSLSLSGAHGVVLTPVPPEVQ